MPRYLLRVTSTHLTFRIPNILSIGQLYGFEIKLVSEDLERGALVIDLEREEHVQYLLDRALPV
jgi:tRNA (guanine10-N2)-methyltransferase